MPGTWTKFANAPGFQVSTMLLLTDGSVMCWQSGGVAWSRLALDATGSYVNGTWSPLAPMLNTRLYYASAVLRDGRRVVCDGEYGNAGSPDGSSTQNETNRCEMYDLVINVWRTITPSAGWTTMGDAPSPCSLTAGYRLATTTG